MSRVASALIAELGPEDLAELAVRLAPYLPERAPERDQWLNSADAAQYLGLSKHGLHRLTSERLIPFSQDGPGSRVYFRRSDLDRFRSSNAS